MVLLYFMLKLPSPCPKVCRFVFILANLALMSVLGVATAQEIPPASTPTPTPKAAPAPKPVKKAKPQDDPADAGLQNVSTMDMGATAKNSGLGFNKDWPANATLQAGYGGGGTLINNPLKGGRVDIRLIVPVDIKAVEVVPLDYHGTQQPKAIDIYIDGKEAMKDVQLPHNPGYPFRIPLEAHGQNVGILITDIFPEPPDMPKERPGDMGVGRGCAC